MIGSFPSQSCSIRASGLHRFDIPPIISESFLTCMIIQKVKSNVYLPVE